VETHIPDRNDELRKQLQEALSAAYEIERELGRGGMATVYLAHDQKHDRPVALKVLHPDLGAALGPERFRREVHVAARLQHPHILPVFDSGDAVGRLWYTMPYVAGESLRDRLVRERQLSVEEAVRIVREAAQGLHHAHRHGVIHRDVKPENILLTEDGTTLVADFGIARAMAGGAGSGPGGVTQLTGTGLAIGTPAYMSPEQGAGERDVDPRSDVYSLGAVLYELLAGEPPFTGATPQAILAKRFATPAPSVRVVRPGVSAELEAALARALATAPADRFETAADFNSALGAAVGGTSATGLDTAGSLRRRWLLIGVAAMLLALVGATTWYWRGQSLAPKPAGGSDLSLAVIPFENLGDSADAYFADGITDEVRGKLAALRQLRVIASASSRQYRSTSKPPREIARELGVRYLLMGRVRWQKRPGDVSRVRVDPELVDVAGGPAPATTWQQPFDAELSDVFRVQSEIAEQVAAELRLALADKDQAVLTSVPTKSLDAYDAYLRGRDIRLSGGANLNSLYRSVAAFRQAVTLDSTFVRAWLNLAMAYTQIACCSGGPRVYVDSARIALDRLRALAPQGLGVQAAEANFQGKVLYDWEGAISTGSAALEKAPNDILLLQAIGAAEGALGRWEAQTRHFRQALLLDPRNVAAGLNVGLAELLSNHAEGARVAFDRALSLQPSRPDARVWRAEVEANLGDSTRARAILRNFPVTSEKDPLLVQTALQNLSWLLDEPEQTKLLALEPTAFGGNRAYWAMSLAEMHLLRGDSLRARHYADSAHTAIQRMSGNGFNELRLQLYDAIALALMGRRAESTTALARAMETGRRLNDVTLGLTLRNRVWLFLALRDRERALAELEAVQRSLTAYTPGRLRLDPHFQSLRGEPRFERFVAAR
jgi:eukaryotic-like serine/threonine-protein kinase